MAVKNTDIIVVAREKSNNMSSNFKWPSIKTCEYSSATRYFPTVREVYKTVNNDTNINNNLYDQSMLSLFNKRKEELSSCFSLVERVKKWVAYFNNTLK